MVEWLDLMNKSIILKKPICKKQEEMRISVGDNKIIHINSLNVYLHCHTLCCSTATQLSISWWTHQHAVSRQLWGHLAAPLLHSPALSFPLAPSTPPSIPGTSIERGVLGTADRSLRWPPGTHAFLCGHTHGQVIRAWCRDSDLELIKGEVTLAEPSAKPFKRVQRPPLSKRRLLSLKILLSLKMQPSGSYTCKKVSSTNNHLQRTLSLQPCQSRQRTQLVSAQTVAHTDHKTMSVCVLNHWLAVQRGRVINTLDTLEHGPQQLVGITPITWWGRY